MKNAHLIIAILALSLLAACAPSSPEAAATTEGDSPFYLVSVPADATATPTPFRPVAAGAADGQQAQATATLSDVQSSATPFPSPTTASEAQPTPAIVTTAQPVLDAPESVTFLLLGSDSRGGASFRTDTIMVVAVRPHDGQVSLISIPRDLWVNIPTVGMQRINTAYQYGQYSDYPGGGPGLLKDTILFNLGLQIDHTALVDFDGFRRIVNTLGGVDVPISCPYTDWRLLDQTLDPEDANNWTLYTAGPGLVHMDGDLALWYARSRKKSNDFDRGRRQQEVMRSLYAQALSANLISRIPQLYGDLSGTVTTDLGLGDILGLAPLAGHLTNAEIRSYYVAGNLVTGWITPGGADVLLPNTTAIQAMLKEALAASPRQQQRNAIKVEIQNGSSIDGLDTLAAQRLNYAGYATTIHSADNRQHRQTLLYDLTPGQDRNSSAALLAVLGLPDLALVSAPSNNSQSAYALIVGDDYHPCFDPHGLAP